MYSRLDRLEECRNALMNLGVREITPPSYLEVRGEVFMTFTDFESLNNRRIDAGLDRYANARNATAGCLKFKKTRDVRELIMRC